jgi:hypothetical protein
VSKGIGWCQPVNRLSVGVIQITLLGFPGFRLCRGHLGVRTVPTPGQFLEQVRVMQETTV